MSNLSQRLLGVFRLYFVETFFLRYMSKILSLFFALIISFSGFAQGFPIDPSLINSSGIQTNRMNTRPATGSTTGVRSPNSNPRKVNSTAKEKSISDSLELEKKNNIDANEPDSAIVALRKKIFGFNIFNNPKLNFSEDLRMATPKGYILGPDDEILLDINGYSEAHYVLPVSPDGFVRIEKIGNVFVNGITIEEAKSRLLNRLSKIYVGLRSYEGYQPNTFLTVSLGSIRTIKVTVQGEVMVPGTYSVPSLARVMNVLYQAGGPNENGTFRDIRVIRNKRVIASLDLYDFLTSGIQRNDITLNDQDIIKVGVYKSRIEIAGKVKKPGIFENNPNESLDKIMNEYAGGFTPDAYKQLLKIIRYTSTERKLTDLSGDLISSFMPLSGDVINVEGVLVTRFENMVALNGSVFREGQYSVSDNQTLTKLIKRADGFREDAFLGRISITRIRDDLQKEQISVNYNDILTGKIPDVVLKREDIVTVYSSRELQEAFTIRIRGEVNFKPRYEGGVFPFQKNMTVEDLIAEAGGLKESAATGRIEVTRRKKNIGKDDPNAITSQIAENKTFAINKDLILDQSASTFVLEPFDEIFVRSSPNYEKQQFVTIEGQVIFPSIYGIERKDEKLSDIIKRAGGLNQQAFPAGATLVRKVQLSKLEVEQKRKQLADLNDNARNVSLEVEQVEEITEQSIGIDLLKAIDNPGGVADLLLQDGDLIRIPKEPQTVRMQGEVLYPTSTRYVQGLNFKDYIAQAGGFTALSAKNRAFIIYANGSVDRTRKFLFFNVYPKVEQGAQIIVPKRANQVTAQSISATIGTVAQTFAIITGMVTTLLTYRILK